MYRFAGGARRALGASGTRRLARSPIARPLRRALNGDAPDGPRIVEVVGGALRGARLSVDLATEKYYWLGTHEPKVQALLSREVRRGDVCWDIGAHAGFFTMLMARLAGDGGRVYAFEPLDDNVARLEAGVHANGLRNVVVCPTAVGDRTGGVAFATGATSLEGRIGDGGATAVACLTIDDAVAGGFAPPALIKIDAEGAEDAVIRGARETIARQRPRLLVEVHNDAAGKGVIGALSVAYRFTNITTGDAAPLPLVPGHYFGVPVEGDV